MLPLIPAALSMSLLLGATLFIVSPSGERQATVLLADDMLRYHQAVGRAVVDADPATLTTNLAAVQAGLDLGPFQPLVGWQSALADEIAVDSDGAQVLIARWVVTWPVNFADGPRTKLSDLAAIPGRLRAAGYRNSQFGSWVVLSAGAIPSGRVDDLIIEGLNIPAGAPVIANLVGTVP